MRCTILQDLNMIQGACAQLLQLCLFHVSSSYLIELLRLGEALGATPKLFSRRHSACWSVDFPSKAPSLVSSASSMPQTFLGLRNPTPFIYHRLNSLNLNILTSTLKASLKPPDLSIQALREGPRDTSATLQSPQGFHDVAFRKPFSMAGTLGRRILEGKPQSNLVQPRTILVHMGHCDSLKIPQY